jgi:DNA polymerase-3 subunit gamma/tau
MEKPATPEYRAFVDKYRPRKLGSVVGQDVAVGVIRGMIKTKRVPPSILISGPYGCGKTTLARILARYVNCQHENGADECDGCPSCDDFRTGHHPDIHEIDSGSMRGIDNVRDLKRVAPFAPRYNKRIYILDEVQGLSPDAFRAALKMLEEPPKNTIFILSTNEPQKLPPTIQDRCMGIELKEPRQEVVAKHIFKIAKKEGFDFDRETCEKVARAANGHIRSAVRLLEQVVLYAQAHGGKADGVASELPQIIQKVLGLPNEQSVVTYVRSIIKGDAQKALGIIAFLQEKGLSADAFLPQVISSIRNHIFFLISPKQLDGRYFKIVTEVKDDLKKWSVKEVTTLLGEYLSAYERMKQYVVPQREVLDYVTFRALAIKSKKE